MDEQESAADAIAGRGHTIPTKRKFAFATITVVAFFVVLEGGLRLCVEAPEAERFQQISQMVLFLGTQPSDLMLDFDSERFWRLRKNITVEDPRNTYWQGTVTNSHGCRSPEFQLIKQPGTLRIVCFGDSSTFGIGATMEDTWPYQLQALLQQSLDTGKIAALASDGKRLIEVINAGVPGYSSYQGLQHMRQEIDRLRPDIVFASYANNDFWQWDQMSDRQHAKRINRESTADRLVMTTRLGQLFASGISRARAAYHRQLRTASPNEHWAEAATQSYFEPRTDWIPRVSQNEFRANINQMADLCDERKLALVLVKWPDQRQAAGSWSRRIEYHDILDEIASRRGLCIADVVTEFQNHRSWSVRTYVPNDIVHVNGAGNRLAADAALAALYKVLNRAEVLTN